MSQTIVIEIVDKVATCLTKKAVVCGNSKYVVDFVFDEEWDEHEVKTAVFIVNGECYKVVFEGNVCKFPVIQNTMAVKVGVFAGTIDDGTLSTSTPALVRCKACVTDGDTVPAHPQDDVYNQIVGLCNEAVSTAKSVEERANNGEFKGEDGKDGVNGKDGINGKDGADGKDGEKGEKGDDGYTPQKGVDYFTPEEKAEFVKEVEDACLGEIETALDELHAYAQSLVGGNA